MANVVRTCMACGQADDHPKCQVITPPDHASTFFHHDCHAAMDPPCPACTWLVEHKGDLRGEEWREHVISLHQELSEEDLLRQPHELDVVASHRGGRLNREGA